MRGLSRQVSEALREGRFQELESLVAAEPRAVRFLLAATFRPEPEIRAAAGRGLAVAARHHPALVKEVVRRLIWGMNEESGTNASGAPDTLYSIADEAPDLLVPVMGDLMRLTADPNLHDRLIEVAQKVASRRPTAAADRLEASLLNRLKGKDNERGDSRPAPRR
jgi:hypothetical protein